jgi:hypothetical protein
VTEPGLNQKVKKKFSATPFLDNLVYSSFILGLLSILHQVALFSILYQVLPDPQTIDFFGIKVHR